MVGRCGVFAVHEQCNGGGWLTASGVTKPTEPHDGSTSTLGNNMSWGEAKGKGKSGTNAFVEGESAGVMPFLVPYVVWIHLLVCTYEREVPTGLTGHCGWVPQNEAACSKLEHRRCRS